MAETIFVSLSTFAAEDPAPLRLLEESGHTIHLNSTGKRITAAELIREARDAAVIIAGVESYDAAVLAQLPELRCISRCGTGVDAIDLGEAKRRGIAVANTPDTPVQAVAELALGLFIALSRNLFVQAELMRQRRWERTTAHLLSGRSVGIIGFGRIGRRVAELVRAFGARVLAHDPARPDLDSATPETAVRFVSKEELLAQSDIISLHASGGGVLLGAEEFAHMKPGVLIVNLARGGMLDEGVLLSALNSGSVAGAGLDVFSKEPYTGELCGHPRVILTPHSATMTLETRVAMELECANNALDFLLGRLSVRVV